MSTDLPTLLVVGIVAVLAVVQSMFGVGLLLFGTPTLLLLGMPFAQVLVYLLPCSIVVSVLQVATSGGTILDSFDRKFLVWAVPSVVAGTLVTLSFGSPPRIKLLVGVVLLLTAIIRIGPLSTRMQRGIRRAVRPTMVGMGVVHGLSNLGGGILTVLVSACFGDKFEVRRHIAFAYGAMAGMQLLLVIATVRPHVNPMLVCLLPVLAGTAFLTVGQRAFRAVGQSTYQVLLNGLILCFGTLLVTAA